MRSSELKLLERHMPASVRRALGLRVEVGDPGLEIFRRFAHGRRLQALVPAARRVHWHNSRHSIQVRLELKRGGQVTLPPLLLRVSSIPDDEGAYPAHLRLAARQLSTAPAQLYEALKIVQRCARIFANHTYITFPT